MDLIPDLCHWWVSEKEITYFTVRERGGRLEEFSFLNQIKQKEVQVVNGPRIIRKLFFAKVPKREPFCFVKIRSRLYLFSSFPVALSESSKV